MKHLKKFESEQHDFSDDIRNIFLPILDLGCVELEVSDSTTQNHTGYYISWNYKIDLFLGDISELPDFKKGTRRLNEIIEESYLIIETLVSMGFVINNYDIEFNWGTKATDLGNHFKEAQFSLDIKHKNQD
jgi:hypothetical protein